MDPEQTMQGLAPTAKPFRSSPTSFVRMPDSPPTAKPIDPCPVLHAPLHASGDACPRWMAVICPPKIPRKPMKGEQPPQVIPSGD